MVGNRNKITMNNLISTKIDSLKIKYSPKG